MSTDSTNPYATPRFASPEAAAPDASADWKVIARRWEKLRLLYNGLLLIAGLAALAIASGPNLAPTVSLTSVVFIALYAVAANACYTWGPIAEMYVSWLVEAVAPAPFLAVFRDFRDATVVTWLLFLPGATLSLLLTLGLGLAAHEGFA